MKRKRENLGGSALSSPPKKEIVQGGILSPRPYDKEIFSEIERLRKKGLSEVEILRQISLRSRGETQNGRKNRRQRSENDSRKES